MFGFKTQQSVNSALKYRYKLFKKLKINQNQRIERIEFYIGPFFLKSYI